MKAKSIMFGFESELPEIKELVDVLNITNHEPYVQYCIKVIQLFMLKNNALNHMDVDNRTYFMRLVLFDFLDDKLNDGRIPIGAKIKLDKLTCAIYTHKLNTFVKR